MKEQSTTKGFAVLSLAGIIVKIISLAYVPFLIKAIGKEGYGVYAAAYEIFTLMYVVTNSGMQTAISKQVSELIALDNPKDALKTFKLARSILLLTGFAVAMIMIIFAKPFAVMTDNNDAVIAIMSLAPAIMITSVLAAYKGYFQGRSIMTPTAISQIIEQLLNVPVSLLFAYVLYKQGVEYGAAGGTIGTTIGALAACIFLIYVYKKNRIKIHRSNNEESEVKVVRHSNKELVKRLFKYGIPITLSSGLQYFGSVIDMAVVKNRLKVAGFLLDSERNIKFASLSQYRTLINVPLTIIAALSSAVIPAISRAVVLKDKKEMKEKITFAFKTSYMVSIPCAVGLAVLSKSIYDFIYIGDSSGYELMMYGSIAIVFMSIVQIQTVILQCVNKLYAVLLSLAIGIGAKLLSNYFLIAMPSVNINGAIIGTILSYLIPMIINHRIMQNSLKIRIGIISTAIKPFISAALMGVVVYICNANLSWIFSIMGNGYLMRAIPTLTSVFIGVVVYTYGLVLTGGITRKDLNSFSPRIVKIMPKGLKRRLR